MKIKDCVRYTAREWIKSSEADRKIYKMAKKFIQLEKEEAKHIGASIQRRAEARKPYDDDMETEGSSEAGIHEEITARTETAVKVDIYDEQTENKAQSMMKIKINANAESPVQASINKKSTVHTNRCVRAGNWKIKHKRSRLCYERQKKCLKRQHRKIAPGYMETLIWPHGVKLPKRVEGRPSEDSPEIELQHYTETLCDQPEFMSQVEGIIQPALLDTILSPDRNMDLQTRIDELQQEEDVIPMEVEEIIQPALLDTDLSPDIDMDFRTLIDEMEEEEDVLPMEVEENIKPAFLDRDLFLDTYKDFHTLNNEPERVDKLLPLEFMEIRENQSTANKPIVLPEEKDAPSSTFTSNSNKINQTIPDMKILEMPNYTAGTRKTKESSKSTQSKGYTIINDIIVIDDD